MGRLTLSITHDIGMFVTIADNLLAHVIAFRYPYPCMGRSATACWVAANEGVYAKGEPATRAVLAVPAQRHVLLRNGPSPHDWQGVPPGCASGPWRMHPVGFGEEVPEVQERDCARFLKGSGALDQQDAFVGWRSVSSFDATLVPALTAGAPRSHADSCAGAALCPARQTTKHTYPLRRHSHQCRLVVFRIDRAFRWSP